MRKVLRGIQSILTYKSAAIAVPLLLTSMVTLYAVFLIQPPTAPIDSELEEAISERKIDYSNLMTELEARAAKFPGEAAIFIKDLKTGQTLGINSSKLFPSASLVKLPIMAALYKAQAEEKVNLDSTLPILRKHKIRDASRLYFVRSGTKFSIRELIKRMVTESDNTATNVLVDSLGFGYLNQKFVEFGLKSTDLRRGVMDLKWRKAGIENYTTAEDMALILEKIYQGKLISAQASEDMLSTLKKQKVNDRIPRWLPHGLVVAHKTGLLHDTVSDCGIVFTSEGDFIICVLTGDIRGYHTAKRFISKIAECTYDRCYNKTAPGTRL